MIPGTCSVSSGHFKCNPWHIQSISFSIMRKKKVCLSGCVSVQYILMETKVVITCRGLKPSATEDLNESMIKGQEWIWSNEHNVDTQSLLMLKTEGNVPEMKHEAVDVSTRGHHWQTKQCLLCPILDSRLTVHLSVWGLFFLLFFMN